MSEEFKITGPDGQVYKVTAPDGTTKEEALAYFESQQGGGGDDIPTPPGAKPAASDAPELSWAEVGAQAITNVPESGKQFFKDMWQAVRHPIETGGTLLDVADGAVRLMVPGGDSPNEDMARLMGDYFTERYTTMKGFKHAVANEPVMVLSDIAAIMTGGGALGAKLPGIAGKIASTVGTVGAAIDPAALPFKVAGRALNPKTRPEVERLMDQGVTPTPGQILGGVAKSVEDKLTSYPLLGDVIGVGRRRAVGDLNAAAYDRALNPIGKTATAARGAEGIAHVSDELSDAYKALMPKLHLFSDNLLLDDIVAAVEKAGKLLTEDGVAHLQKVVDSLVMDHLSQSVKGLAGEKLKTLLADLGKASDTMTGSATATERTMGNALGDIGAAIQKNLERHNPKHADELRAIDTGYANYVRLRAAGKMAGADQPPGFSPTQLRSAVSAMDKSVGKGDTARGRSLMQGLSRDATEVMGYGIPDSGTAGRSLLALAVAGGAGAIEPMVGIGLAALAGPYIPGGQRLAATLLAGRKPIVRKAGDLATRTAPVAGQAVYRTGRLERDLRDRPPLRVGINPLRR